MIASISGRVSDKSAELLVVELGGMGLAVHVTADLASKIKLGQLINLFTYLVVRENELSLYGFASKEEREYFTLLIGVSGIGPRIALATLSTLNPATIRRAIFNEQADVLSRVPGIGHKGAQRMLLHLKDKLKDTEGLEMGLVEEETDTEVMAALTALGYSIVESQAAVQFIPKDAPDDLEARIRIALSYFSA